MLHSILGNLGAESLIDNNTVIVILCQDMSPSSWPLLGQLVHVRLCLPLTRGSLTAPRFAARFLYQCCSHINRIVEPEQAITSYRKRFASSSYYCTTML